MSLRVAGQPVLLPFQGRLPVLGEDFPGFVADGMDGDDPATFHEEPKNAGIEFADVTQLEEIIVDRLRERLTVVLAVPQLGQSGQDGSMVVRVSLFEFFQKILDGVGPSFRGIKLYREFHAKSTSRLMYFSLPPTYPTTQGYLHIKAGEAGYAYQNVSLSLADGNNGDGKGFRVPRIFPSPQKFGRVFGWTDSASSFFIQSAHFSGVRGRETGDKEAIGDKSPPTWGQPFGRASEGWR